MDNCGPHGANVSDPMGQVKLINLPPNCTSVHQPMDAGIIAALKKRYRHKLLMRITENIERHNELRALGGRMTAGTAGLNEGKQAHLLDAQCILYECWRDMEEVTIARSWAKTNILPLDLEADIRAEHGSSTRSHISDQCARDLESIILSLRQLSLPDDCDDDTIRGLMDLVSSNSDDKQLRKNIETWMVIEETDDFIQLEMEEKASSVSEEAFIQSVLTSYPDSDSSNEEMEDCINNEMKSIKDLDVTEICCTLVEIQQLLEQHGVPAAADAIEHGRNLMMRASWTARRPVVPERTCQTLMDVFLKKK